MEFLLLIGFIFLIAVIFMQAFAERFSDFSDAKKKDAVKDICQAVRDELVMASVVKDGYARNLTLPQKIDNTLEYNLSITNSTLAVSIEDYVSLCVIPHINGTLSKGTNEIRKYNGTITIHQV